LERSGNGQVPVKVGKLFRAQTFDVIADMSTGRIPNPEDIVKEFVEVSEKISLSLRPQNIRNLVPFYKYLPIEDECTKWIKRRDQIFDAIIEEHKRTLDPENPGDFLDALLIEQAQNEEMANIYIKYLLLDTYLLGIDTSAVTMEYFAVLMPNYPEIQKKIHPEIDVVLGNREPELSDEEKLPYLSATLKEVMRLCSVAAVNRIATQDMFVGKYKIVKGANPYFSLTFPREIQNIGTDQKSLF
jgi:cytochrome P450